METRVWLHDGSPGARRNDTRRDGVGRPSESAYDALEARLRRTIRSFDVPAGEARLRRVAGIDQQNWHPGTRRLVLHEGAQLSEGPITVARTLPPTNRCPVTNSQDLFQGQPAPGVFGGAHQCLADAVVRVTLDPRLLAVQPLDLAFGRTCLAALQITAAIR